MRDRYFPSSTDRYQPEHYRFEGEKIASELESKIITKKGSTVQESTSETRRISSKSYEYRGGRNKYFPKEKPDYQPTKFVIRDESEKAKNLFNHKKFVEEEISDRSQTLHRSILNVRDSKETMASLRHHSWRGEGYF